jgi:hypothetical protein
VPELAAEPSLVVLADLHIVLTSEHGDATAHLRGDGQELVLDVDNPAVLLHEARRQKQRLPDLAQLGFDRLPVRIRSGGRDLGRVWLTPGDKIHVRPTPAGLLSALSIALSDGRSRRIAIGGASVLATALAAGLVNRVHHRRR